MIRVLIALLVLCIAAPAAAHKASDSYLSLSVTDQGAEGRWDIALRDLELAIGLDQDGDGAITWGELKARHHEIAAHALARLTITSEGRACSLSPGAQLVEQHSDGAYTVLAFTADCGAPVAALTLDYGLFFEFDALHRGLLQINQAGVVTSGILSPERPQFQWRADGMSRLGSLLQYLEEGAWHIWIGFDHILFLVTLLLPAVLRRTKQGWRPAADVKGVLLPVVKVVSAFTLAHSITLSLATLGVVELPSRLVESAIAGSVVIAALNNLWPIVTGRLWLVAFGFGLVHGFGFASVLADLGLPGGALLWALFGFNLGVELGQLAIVALVIPIIFLVRRTRFYPQVALPAGSLAIAAVASLWLVERAFDLAGPLAAL